MYCICDLLELLKMHISFDFFSIKHPKRSKKLYAEVLLSK